MTNNKIVVFTKNGNQLPVNLSNTTKVKELEADGWEAVQERVMRLGDKVSVAKDDAQQAAFEKFGFVFEKFQSPKL